MLKNKTITFIGLNYAPEDTAIGLYSTQMVNALVAAGAHVNVVTAMPYYPQWKIQQPYNAARSIMVEKEKGQTIYRYKQYVPRSPTFLKRVFHILSFTHGSWRNLKKIEKCDLVISIIPFTTSAFLGNKHAKKHKVPHWIHVQDFEFDAAVQSGLSGNSKQIFKWLFKQESALFNKATAISTISQTMLQKLQTKTTTSIFYLPNWIDPAMIGADFTKPHPYLASHKFKLLYSGNVGEKQDWEFFSAFAKALPPQYYDIIIVGAGARFQDLKQSNQQENIGFHDPVPYAQLGQLLGSADAHFLFQKKEIVDTVMPSKLLGMMASGKPSLVCGNLASEVRTILERADTGFYFSTDDLEFAVRQLEAWRLEPDSTDAMGKRAKEFVWENFSREKILNNWIGKLSKQLYVKR